MGKGRRKLFEIFFILLIINIGLVGVPSAYAGSIGDPVCGDGVCEGDEAKTCEQDCSSGPVCGNGVCEDGEDSKTCAVDCSSGPVDCSVEEDNTPCDLGNTCTQSACVSSVCIIKNLPAETQCDDGNSCTFAGICDGLGSCDSIGQKDGILCDDGNACTSESVCTSLVCGGGSPISCNDENACTADSCDPAKGCLSTPVPENTACDDGLFCTDGDVCSGGVCKSTSATCTSSQTCDESNDECVAGPVCGDGIIEDPETCDDGNTNPGDGCSDTCQTEGLPPVCGDGVVDDGEECDDGNNESNDGCSDTCTLESVGCTVDTDCASGQVCDTNTATCVQEETKQTEGSVNILETCGLAFVLGDPILYPPVLPGGISNPEQLLVLDNTGNVVAILLVKGGDWVDGGNNVIMNVGDTKYAIIAAQDYTTQKTALTGADVVVTPTFDPVVDQNTYWQLQANLLNNNFAGDLTQTMDFTVSC